MASSSRSRFGLLLALALAVLAGAIWTRAFSAAGRQFHADEGAQAYQAWRLIETGAYRYDPTEHHGPTLYFVAKWLYPIISDQEGGLDDFRMRLAPLLFGVGSVALGMFALFRERPSLALIWGTLAAFAPLPVIYGAYFAQESLLAFFTLAALVAAFAYAQRPGLVRAALCGLGVGLMFATKETAAIHALAIAAGLAFAGCRWRTSIGAGARHAGLAIGVASIVAAFFFSSMGAHPAGVGDALSSFFHYAERAQGQGHEKPAFYYLSLLLPQTREGARWGEPAFVLCAAIGLGLQVARRQRLVATGPRLSLAWSGFGFASLALYSLIPYKQPWLLLTPYCGLAVAAAFGLRECFVFAREANGPRRWLALGGAMALALWLMAQTGRSCQRAIATYPSASRNPYLYQHTTPRYRLLLDRLEQLRNQSTDPEWSLGVYSPDHAWPLPWHLRDWERVGYWAALDPFVPHSVDAVDSRILGDALPTGDGAQWELFGLRPNTLIALRVSQVDAAERIEDDAGP